MDLNWRKVENEKGFIFYMNDKNIKQWDHPQYSDIMMQLDECNYIKFATYRVASKFRVLQHALYMSEIPLNIVISVFEKHRLGTMENSLPLESCDLEAVLSDIFFGGNKLNHTNTDVDFATELVMNFIYNVFDHERINHVEVLSAKLTLALLSNCKLNDLNKYLFTLCSDHNNCVTRLRLQQVISKVCCLTTYLNETISFGKHLINATIEQCFNSSPGLVGINEGPFCAWLEDVPQVLAWLPILHRFKISETVLHSGKCSVCKVTPLMGLKYKCIKCSNYKQCQRCFLTGRTSHSHKLTHVMKEHCRQKSSKILKKFVQNKMGKLLKWKYRVSEDTNTVDNKPLSGTSNDLLLKANEHTEPCNIEPLSSPLVQLQVVIRQLELQNKELQSVLSSAKRNDKDIKSYLEQHRQHVSMQIGKLKVLKEYFNTTDSNKPYQDNLYQNKSQKNNSFPNKSHGKMSERVQSTPMLHNQHGPSLLRRGIKEMDFFSPIPQLSTQLSFESPLRSPKSNPRTYNIESSGGLSDFSVSNPFSMKDLSTWIGGRPQNNDDLDYDNLQTAKPIIEQTDLDDALAKLQQILANNYSLDESLGVVDNCQLKSAVNEVEGVLSSIIDNVETNQQHQNYQNVSSAASACSVSEFKSFSTPSDSFFSAQSHWR